MILTTSYYANLKKIPESFLTVAASLMVPQEIQPIVDVWDTDLAPSKSILFDYKKTGDTACYVERFKTEIIPKIDWLEKLEVWEENANKIGKKFDGIVLLCFEAPTDFCHRHILAEHFENEFNCVVPELGCEHMVRSNHKMVVENNTNILF